jgi:hypothetical protein
LGRTQREFTSLLDTSFGREFNRLNTFFDTTPVRRLATDQDGVRIPLQQFMAGRFRDQVDGLARAFGEAGNNLAALSLFADGVTTAPTDVFDAFVPQVTGALNTAAFEIGSGLAAFDGLDSSIGAGFQSSFFDTDPTVSSLVNEFQGLPNDSLLFRDAFTGVIDRTLETPVNNFIDGFDIRAISTPLNTSRRPFVTTAANDFGFGFNNGFGTGFIGLGQPAEDSFFNPSLGTGFTNVVTTAMPTFGFTIPSPIGFDGTGTGI